MTETVIVVVAIAAGFACPLDVWWSHRHGRQAACCPPLSTPESGRTTNGNSELDMLRTRQQTLASLIGQHEEIAAAATAEPARLARRN